MIRRDGCSSGGWELISSAAYHWDDGFVRNKKTNLVSIMESEEVESLSITLSIPDWLIH